MFVIPHLGFSCVAWMNLQASLRRKVVLRLYKSAYDLIQFDSIRNALWQRLRANTFLQWRERNIRFVCKEALWGEKRERKHWLISSGASECAEVFLFGRRGKKINIMSPNCLCVSLFSSLFSLHPLSLTPSSHRTTLRQLLLCSQIKCSPVAFVKCEINKCYASEGHIVLGSTHRVSASPDVVSIQSNRRCPPHQSLGVVDNPKSPTQLHPSLSGPIYCHHVILLVSNIRFTSQQEGQYSNRLLVQALALSSLCSF